MTFLALGISLALGLIHYFAESFKSGAGSRRNRIFSFAAGISIAYIFLDLLPHTYQAAVHLQNWVFIFLLLGFAAVHISEKYVYQHTSGEKTIVYLKEIHILSFLVYYFLVGIVLLDRIQTDVLEGGLFVVPISLHAALSTASIEEIHGAGSDIGWFSKISLAVAPLCGVILAAVLPVPKGLDNAFVSFIAGVLLYIVIKEFLPEKRKGQPMFFLFGISLFMAVYFFIQTIRKG